MPGERKETRPFHKSVVGVLDKIQSASNLAALENVILTTKIPEDHDKIFLAYLKAIMRIGAERCNLESDVRPVEIARKLILESESMASTPETKDTKAAE